MPAKALSGERGMEAIGGAGAGAHLDLDAGVCWRRIHSGICAHGMRAIPPACSTVYISPSQSIILGFVSAYHCAVCFVGVGVWAKTPNANMPQSTKAAAKPLIS